MRTNCSQQLVFTFSHNIYHGIPPENEAALSKEVALSEDELPTEVTIQPNPDDLPDELLLFVHSICSMALARRHGIERAQELLYTADCHHEINQCPFDLRWLPMYEQNEDAA